VAGGKVSFQRRLRNRAGPAGTVAIRTDAGRHSAQCPHIRGNVGASFRLIVHRCGAGRLCAIERLAADSATREVRHGMRRRASVPGNGVPLRRDRPAGIDTVHHDARHVRCRTDVAARAGHRTRGAWLPGRCGAQRWPCPVHRPRPGAPSWFARPGSLPNPAPLRVAADPATPTEPFLGQQTQLRHAGEAHACTARGPIPIGQAGAARASAPGPWIPRPVTCVVDDSRGIRESRWRRGRALEHSGEGSRRCEARRSARRRDVPLNVMPCPPTAIPRNASSGRLVYGSEQTPRRCARILISGSITGSQSGVRVDAPKRMSPKRGRQPTRRSIS
jgi:hypothetical protein